MKERELSRLKEKQRKLEEEILLIHDDHKQVEIQSKEQQKVKDDKKERFVSGIEEMKKQNQLRRLFEKQRENMANELSHTYFPYTHGDHIEKERLNLKKELKAEF